MKNLAAYLDDFIQEDDYFEGFKKSCGKITTKDYMKAHKKASREEEIKTFGKQLSTGGSKPFKNKKQYNRNEKHKKKL